MQTQTLKPTTLDALRASREIVAAGPSGHAYRIRPLNLERHALAGGLPARLRQIALQGVGAINELFASDDDSELSRRGEELREYLDALVRQVIVEPDLADVDLDILPPVDYRWAVGIAMGEVDRDGDGQPLWGREALSRWATFRGERGSEEDRGGSS